MTEKSEFDAIKVAIDVAEGIIVEADGNPAVIVACGAAVAVVVVSVAVSYTAYHVGNSAYTGVKYLWDAMTA